MSLNASATIKKSLSGPIAKYSATPYPKEISFSAAIKTSIKNYITNCSIKKMVMIPNVHDNTF